MKSEPRSPRSGLEILLLGLAIAAIGTWMGFASRDGALFVWAVAWLVAGPLIAVGIVSVGVTHGLRYADHLRSLDD